MQCGSYDSDGRERQRHARPERSRSVGGACRIEGVGCGYGEKVSTRDGTRRTRRDSDSGFGPSCSPQPENAGAVSQELFADESSSQVVPVVLLYQRLADLACDPISSHGAISVWSLARMCALDRAPDLHLRPGTRADSRRCRHGYALRSHGSGRRTNGHETRCESVAVSPL